MFTRRHFTTIATLIKHTRTYSPGMQIGIDFFANELIKLFKTDNRKFDETAFRKASGLEIGDKS
jgi:hypothetical protein